VADVVLNEPSIAVVTVVPAGVNSIDPEHDHCPAVSETLVMFVGVALEIETADAVFEII